MRSRFTGLGGRMGRGRGGKGARGGGESPPLGGGFLRHGPRCLAVSARGPAWGRGARPQPGERGEPSWDAVIALEPGERRALSAADIDAACAAMADFSDLNSTYTLTHSSGVAHLAAEAARRAGLPDADVTLVRRAALLHDIGRVGV